MATEKVEKDDEKKVYTTEEKYNDELRKILKVFSDDVSKAIKDLGEALMMKNPKKEELPQNLEMTKSEDLPSYDNVIKQKQSEYKSESKPELNEPLNKIKDFVLADLKKAEKDIGEALEQSFSRLTRAIRSFIGAGASQTATQTPPSAPKTSLSPPSNSPQQEAKEEKGMRYN